MSLSLPAKAVQTFIIKWKQPLLILLGVGSGLGLVTILVSYWRKKKLSLKEVIHVQKSKRPVSNRVMLMGLNGSGKSSLLATLTHQQRSHLSESDGFHSVMIKPHFVNKMVEFVEVPGKPDNIQYWPKFSVSARIIFIVVDTNNLAQLDCLAEGLSACLPEAKSLGVGVYFVLNRKGEVPLDKDVEIEKFLCLEGFVKDPKREIFAVSLPPDLPPYGVDQLEKIIEHAFAE